MFNDDIVKFLPPSRGDNQFRILESLLSNEELYGGGFNISKALEHCFKHIKTDHNVFILISDFLHIRKGCERALKILGTRYETLAIVLRDKLEQSFPDTPLQFAVQDPYSKQQMILDPKIIGKRYKEVVEKQKTFMTSIFRRARIDFLEIEIGRTFAIPLVSFLKKRALRKRGV
jgi:hypothetical protein